MSCEEICVVIIPNDFPEKNDHDQRLNEYGKHILAQNIISIKENTKSTDDSERQHPTMSMLVQVMGAEALPSNHSINSRLSEVTLTSLEKHTKEYPCPECKRSLASRLRYHVIPILQLRDTVWIPTNDGNNFLIVCYTELGPHLDSILEELRRAEIGIRSGSKVFMIPLSCALGIEKVVATQKILPSVTSKIVGNIKPKDAEGVSLPITTSLSSIPGTSSEFFKSIRARMTVHKVIGLIRYQSSMTFDYIFFCILASTIAGLGLLESNAVILVASMLVSPLMGPILGFVIGIRVRDKQLWLSGLKSECIGLVVSILTVFSSAYVQYGPKLNGVRVNHFQPKKCASGDYRRLWSGALVALPSGAAAALSVLGGNFGSLVGVAISASLLPPAVNTGLLFSYSLLSVSQSSIGRHSTQQMNLTSNFDSPSTLGNCTTFVNNDYLPLYSCDMAKEAAQLAIYSLIITFINILCICLMVVVVLIIKKVAPITSDDEITEFWRSAMMNADVASNNIASNENMQELVDVMKSVSNAGGLLP